MNRSPRGPIGTLALIVATCAVALAAQAPAPSKGVAFARISETEMREWLTALSSDAMQGRRAFTEGYGLAASYVADQLKRFGVRPFGDAGTYLPNRAAPWLSRHAELNHHRSRERAGAHFQARRPRDVLGERWRAADAALR